MNSVCNLVFLMTSCRIQIKQKQTTLRENKPPQRVSPQPKVIRDSNPDFGVRRIHAKI